MFYFDSIKGRKILRSDLLSGIEHFFTTRECCIYSKEHEMSENLELIEDYLGSKMATNYPIHEDFIQKVISNKFFYENTDGLLIENHGSAFMNFGDCVPIIIYCNHVGMIIHAGWRGTSLKIVQKAVSILLNDYKFNVEDIKVVIGPAICLNCYEVGMEVYSKLYQTVVNHDLGFLEKNNKYFVGLKEINKQQLLEINIHNIDLCPYCTHCGEKLFFSYRYENHTPYRHSAVLKL